ncbi:MAG: ribosome silencing factor [Campylobacteraceae bacterium]|nr:ribosome silencing factor [Campylobacteraceae bacterium]MBT3881718.1 ribosome silencing factor [Campylobacteraceae bacterium]MBT4030959.1 ribosome silencing factor [Campylobacteraceae bacterium]MBT4179330.1 ribosome silencing factor [Campylobacteraceae bacterium]MBT4572328.1 ribosome silencing factor [Campylobacteraceae bacterium]
MTQRIERIISLLDEKKAKDIESFDLIGKSYMVDNVVIATSLNSKHAFSLVNYLKEELKPLGEEFFRVDEGDDWTIVDLGDILVHVMTQSHREKYNMEEFLESIKKGEEL